MTVIAGILGMAILFGVFTLLRPRDRDEACTGSCVGCTRDRGCASKDLHGEHP